MTSAPGEMARDNADVLNIAKMYAHGNSWPASAESCKFHCGVMARAVLALSVELDEVRRENDPNGTFWRLLDAARDSRSAWQEQASAMESRALTAEARVKELEKTQRTPGAEQVCKKCRCNERWWSICHEANCPIRGGREG